MAFRGRCRRAAGCGAVRTRARVSATAGRGQAITSGVRLHGGLLIAGEHHGTIGVWGAFDTDALGAQLRVRIVGSELRRRLPHVDVRLFAPFGEGRLYQSIGGEPVESLARFDASTLRRLADALDLVVVTVDPHDLRDARSTTQLLRGPGSTTRVAWHALGLSETAVDWARSVTQDTTIDRISLLDDGSLAQWRAIGNGRAVAEVPHPAFLAPRHFDRELLDARRQFLQAVNAWPRARRPLVVQGSADDVGSVGRLAVTSFDNPVVALVADPDAGDAKFADAVVDRFVDGQRLPDFASLEDRVAAIAGAVGVVAASPVVRAVAAAFGVPHASLASLDDRPAGVPLIELLAASEPVDDAVDSAVDDAAAEIDDDLDAIVALMPDARVEPSAWSQISALRAALDARGHRLAAERAAMADAVAAERARVEPLERQVAELDAAYQDVRNLEVVRWRVALGDVRARLWPRPKP